MNSFTIPNLSANVRGSRALDYVGIAEWTHEEGTCFLEVELKSLLFWEIIDLLLPAIRKICDFAHTVKFV